MAQIQDNQDTKTPKAAEAGREVDSYTTEELNVLWGQVKASE